MIRKRKMMTALVLAVVMVAGNAMSAFAATRTASGRGYALEVHAFANATVTTNSSGTNMVGEGSKSYSPEVYRNVKIHYAYNYNSSKSKKISGTWDNESASVELTETEMTICSWNNGSMISCNVITYLGVSEKTCNTTGAVAKILY